MMTDTVQNHSLTGKPFDGALVVKVLFVCAITLLLFFVLASRAGADPAPDAPGSTVTSLVAAEGVSEPTTLTATPITYDDASCSICHYSDVQLEHQARGGCTGCHKNNDYTTNMPAINFAQTKGKKGCGVDNNACHSQKSKNPWHGYDPTAVMAAHAVSISALPTDLSAASCSGFDSAGANCHATNSTQSKFIFGSMDVASAHADYSYAANNNLINHDIAVQVSPAITASEDACGLCHDKNSTRLDTLKPEVAKLVLPAQKDGTFSCLTCHNSNRSYVTSDAYSPELQALYPIQVPCRMTSDAALLLPVAPKPAMKSIATGSDSTTSSAPSGKTAATQLDALLSQLSPDLQAQLSGVTDQQQLSAGVLAPEAGNVIPLSALPATSLSSAILFK